MVRTRIDVVPGLVDKALGAARAGTKKKGAELCAMYVEVENGGEGVMVSETGLDVLRTRKLTRRRRSWSASTRSSQRSSPARYHA